MMGTSSRGYMNSTLMRGKTSEDRKNKIKSVD